MLDLIKRLIVTGLDTQAKAIDILDELVKKGKLDEATRAEFIEKIDEKINYSKEKGEELINELSSRILAKNPFVFKNDLEDLSQRIDELSKRVAKLEKEKKKAK